MTHSTNFLFYKLHHAGLINRLMSLEVGLGLAHTTGKTFVMYNLRGNTGRPLDDPSSRAGIDLGKRDLIVSRRIPEIFELLDYPKHLVHDAIDLKEIETFTKDEVVIDGKSLHERYFKVSDGDNEKLFAGSRDELVLLPNANYHLKCYTLAPYSRFFFNRDKSLDNMLASIKFKQEYWDFAKMVADFIGDFNAIHLRLGDHRQNFDVSEMQLDQAINKLSDKKIVLLTDDVTNPMLKNKNVILLDDIIVDNFAEDFIKLPSSSETVFGLVSALTLIYANEFIGTWSSTFSSYIHRERNKVKQSTFLYLGIQDYGVGFPYSWNLPNNEGYNSISREWPESKLNL